MIQLKLLFQMIVVFFICKFCRAGTSQLSYSYQYSIDYNDLISQHWQSQHEDFVHGTYSFLQPDGVIRTVHYRADDKHGFRAVVDFRKITDYPPRGHLRFPDYYTHPIILNQPVNIITNDLFESHQLYPNLPNTSRL